MSEKCYKESKSGYSTDYILHFLLLQQSVLSVMVFFVVVCYTVHISSIERGFIMGFPGEELVSTAIEKFGDGIIQKMNDAEEQRNREFSYKLKELEFYKGNYDKEIKGIFASWFDFLQCILIASNKNVDENVKREHQKRVDKFSKPENAISLKIQTMKYCGTRTGEMLALFSQISYDASKNVVLPKLALVYATCLLLATMKQEVLGQAIDPLTIMKVLLNDYEENIDIVNEGVVYVEERKKELFPEL